MEFFKFDGAGNDFVVVDARESVPHLTAGAIARICHRRKGVGADGLMWLTNAQGDYDFEMHYFNSDGYPADMCGNGGRCIALFAHLLGLGHCVDGNVELRFLAADGEHEATILKWDADESQGLVRLGMRDVDRSEVRQVLQGTLLNTGVPHYVQEVHNLDDFDVVGEGRRLRFHPAFGADGANIDFVQPMADGILRVRTYERGVEDETWACGTGVTACALVTGYTHLRTRGGEFDVSFETLPDRFTHICLTGPVSLDFKGSVKATAV